MFWQKHDVHCINNTHSHFKDNNRLPIQRFFSKDGIHLTRSGVKRLFDAMNRNINIVVDYNGPKYRGILGIEMFLQSSDSSSGNQFLIGEINNCMNMH